MSAVAEKEVDVDQPNRRKIGGPIIEASQEPEEYQQALKIILGTVVGVIALVGIIALILLLYRLWKKQQIDELDISQKQLPNVLLLYSDDCPVHEKVAQSLAGYLIESCDCNVFFDLFEEQIIHHRGLDTWLVERLQEADIIMVLCSIGARLRCSKKRNRFKASSDRTLSDYFAVAVDYVGEKMRVERSKDQSLSKFVTVFMDYSTSSDIPPQLEAGARFCLMKDINKLYHYIHGVHVDDNSSKSEDSYPGVTDKNFQNSEVGTELFVAIEQAREYFRKNPNWVDDRLEQMNPPNIVKAKARHYRKNSLEQPLLSNYNKNDSRNLHNSSKVDALIEVHTLPRISKDQTTSNLPYSRQNSLPSSLSSQLTGQISTTQVNISKSYELMPGSDHYNSGICVFCGQETHNDGEYKCPGLKRTVKNTDDDVESNTSRSKSKSMPTVYPNSINSSQTVFQAEVHKAWDEGGRISPSDSQDTESFTGSDTLERDIRSLTVPPTFDHVHYSISSHFFTEPYQLLPTLVHSNSDHRIKPVPTLLRVNTNQKEDEALFLVPSLENAIPLKIL
ncbi:hypothetical protein LOTGIDRAFT_169123 [Lottia gigantea]|uniref:SEFIR domain-containing protein n=1 Tax=Lottia gigantea TaxID=225164 RepID=V3ZHG9_LOTGI|nr:hypothetical protein LOTGIDRAFT_169123 [Lottia gigantea]ESO83647.1 hypothetical protein LOTGIDRAFT_169123 [Lottia gigantea]